MPEGYSLYSFCRYTTFGTVNQNRSFSSQSYRYGFNGKEKDDEINVNGGEYDFGARIYDSRLGRWLTIDPQHQFRLSPYLSFANNPILLIDPDGGWIPGVDDNGRIILTAEKGDNIKTLYTFFGGKKNAEKYLPTVYTGKIAPKMEITTGTKIAFNTKNIFSKAIGDAKNPDNKAKYEDPKDDESGKNYNCHTEALNAARGLEFHNKPNTDIDERNADIKENFENVGASEAVLGETAITFGDVHTATFFGRSQDGTTYVFSKNGVGGGPTINPIYENTGGVNKKDSSIPSYGAVGDPSNMNGHAQNSGSTGMKTDKSGREVGAGGTGIKQSNGTGFYNLKKK